MQKMREISKKAVASQQSESVQMQVCKTKFMMMLNVPNLAR